MSWSFILRQARLGFIYLSRKGAFKAAWFVVSPLAIELVRDVVKKTKFRENIKEKAGIVVERVEHIFGGKQK